MSVRMYTIDEVADFCGVNPATVLLWIKHGKLNMNKSSDGNKGIKYRDLEKFMENNIFPDSVYASNTKEIDLEDDVYLAPESEIYIDGNLVKDTYLEEDEEEGSVLLDYIERMS